ncbi:MAG: hypothetical protein ABI243_02580 [Lapillicoccus sp.]
MRDSRIRVGDVRRAAAQLPEDGDLPRLQPPPADDAIGARLAG